MEAEFDGTDYLLVLDRERNELKKLQQGPLTAKLTISEGKVNKDVLLTYGQTKHVDGIEVTYERQGSGFEGIKEIRVEINHWAYSHIARRGRFSARNGSQTIEIQNGRPPRRPII